AGRGGYASDQGGFTARVSPDGSLALTDSPSFDPHLALPSPRAIGRAVASWYESEKGTFGEGGDTSADKQLQLSAGPSVGQSSPEHTTTAIIPVIGGKLEITDWLMRRHGQDPYASRKLKLLDATRDERVRIGDRHRAEQLALTPQIVRRNLDAMWAATPELRARKRALFELWDECVETGDAGAVAAGEAARQAVIGFIRGHLPAGSAEAYTPAELAELARGRRSKAAFVPYE
ncbi:MAG TPA: hypothetical protein VK601_26460, partial [Kofleriaceae bacterium]|nr:hypothetical protein [Kofleriaceae bacterium]